MVGKSSTSSHFQGEGAEDGFEGFLKGCRGDDENEGAGEDEALEQSCLIWAQRICIV